ncbi:nuclear factor of activated T-cells, cytoplasmic 3 [Betta splendens]|uniref:Nuclear factor of activated T-cells, cytoplasmic 3 n=1 Tax=Betta splendens TaxID=158456 RepID=A0A6P7MRE4_BETSP|nr:nuclear factor of activated T-cells, cytoplasmic 3 [Betta splendens]
MSSLKYAEELDFRLIFEGDGRQAAAPDLHVKTLPTSSQPLAEPPVSQELQSHLPCHFTADTYQSQGPQGGAQGNLRAFDCPSIEITSIAPINHVETEISQEGLAAGGAEGGFLETSWSRDQLYLPLDHCYRDPALSQSPCSSLSSRSWMSDHSCESFSHVYDEEVELYDLPTLGSPAGSPLGSPGCGGGAFGVELWQQKYQHPSAFNPTLSPFQSPLQSPCHSPRTSVTEDSWLSRRPNSRPSSRPTSPCGKRRHTSAEPLTCSPSPHHSPSPTPGASPRGSVTDETWLGSSPGAPGPLQVSGCQDLDVPSKTRRTSGSQLGHVGPEDPPLGEEGHEQEGLAELVLHVPSHFSWNKPKPGNPPLFGALTPPPLDWPLPSQYDRYELKLEVQPKSYHRAHYETEGSRGAIKAAEGHPVVKLSGYSEQQLSLQLFIGTADDRYLRPHAFYQVHRVTGKTVTTTCQERLLGGTKVLEVPLLPENSMSTSIDCAGILKLRNADIELKKGETDIGRKNTRVRVVFRVGIPQWDRQLLWLQTLSIPVECSQRSGQELPQVDSFSPTSCSVNGGEELLIRGSNISTQSRVMFMERGPDGRSLWEMDARVVPEKSSESSIVVEVPRYNKKTPGPVQVQFYVSNGKRRKSLAQNFTFHLSPAAGALLVKQEPWEREHVSHHPPAFTFYDSSDLSVHRAPRSHQTHPLHHPPVSSTTLFPHTSPAITPQIPLQSSIITPRAFTGPPQVSALPPQTSSLPSQVSTMQTPPFPTHPPTSLALQSSPVVPQREQSSCLSSCRSFVPPTDGQKSSLSTSPGQVLNIKQEPEEQPSLGSLGLQEITLDDVNEIIDRDISSLSSSVRPDQFDQYDWQHGSSGAMRFCGGPQ